VLASTCITYITATGRIPRSVLWLFAIKIKFLQFLSDDFIYVRNNKWLNKDLTFTSNMIKALAISFCLVYCLCSLTHLYENVLRGTASFFYFQTEKSEILGNLVLSTSCEFHYDDVTVTSLNIALLLIKASGKEQCSVICFLRPRIRLV